MNKAHLYEAVFLVNQGIDEAVRGLQRLRKARELSEDAYASGAAELETQRSRINLQFFADLRPAEQKDSVRFTRGAAPEPTAASG